MRAVRASCCARRPCLSSPRVRSPDTLTVAAPTSQLQAATAYGALRGLETFAQLVARGSAGLVVTGVTVQDFPRFQHRGILVDSARHFLPVSVLTQFIDAMSYSKFNVLHWHIVDVRATCCERCMPRRA